MEHSNKHIIYKAFMLIILTALITVIITTTLIYKNVNSEENVKYVLVSSEQSGIGEDITTLKKIIDKYYLGEVDEEKLKDSALEGYIDGLGDEYSEYIPKDEYENFTANVMGNYVGIGIYMSIYKDSEDIVILYPMEGSPAEEAGLKSGDIITKVDGVAYSGEEGLDEASSHIKGEEGTNVHLQIKRDEEILEFDITRRLVIINPTTAKVIDGTNIGYIKLKSFDENVCKDFKTKYEELSKQGITSLIIDLRNNGGGIVQEALNIADLFVAKGNTLMYTINKEENEKTEVAKEDPSISLPVIVLVNENSASASEILVSALRDNGVAKAVGTKTYGKGVIQEILKLKDGGAIKITTEEYYTPNKTRINKVGIEPDEIVELPSSSEDTNDTQLNKAIEMLSSSVN